MEWELLGLLGFYWLVGGRCPCYNKDRFVERPSRNIVQPRAYMGTGLSWIIGNFQYCIKPTEDAKGLPGRQGFLRIEGNSIPRWCQEVKYNWKWPCKGFVVKPSHTPREVCNVIDGSRAQWGTRLVVKVYTLCREVKTGISAMLTVTSNLVTSHD